MASFTAIVIGNESLTQQCAERLLARGHRLAALVTRNADVAGWARGQGVRVVDAGPGLAERLGGLRCDWLLSIANLDIIPQAVLDLPAKGAVNFHDGPLPRHAGLNAPVWALVEGEARHGITWHMIEGGIDEGDILEQRLFDIAPGETALTLNTKCFAAGIESFDALCVALETGAPERRAQDLSKRSYHARDDRPQKGGMLDFAATADTQERLIRALDHGGYWNPLCTAKIVVEEAVVHVGSARLAQAQAAPGTVIDVTDASVTIACAQGALVMSGLRDDAGRAVAATKMFEVGQVLGADAKATPPEVIRHDGFWRKRLQAFTPAGVNGRGMAQGTTATLPLAEGVTAATVAAWVLQMAGPCDLALTTAALRSHASAGMVSAWLPLRVTDSPNLATLAHDMAEAVTQAEKHLGFAADLPLRDPAIGQLVTPDIALSLNAGPVAGAALTVELSDQGATLHHDTGAVTPELAGLLAARIDALAAAPDDVPLGDLPRLPVAERDLVLNAWNDTATEYDTALTMHRAFEAQAARTPDATALVIENQSLSYAELNARANRAARVLRDMGVGPDRVVGLCTRRGIDLMVGALAILKAGGAYLPMDPGYPADRLAHFIADSGASVIVTQDGLQADLPRHDAQVLVLDTDPRIAEAAADNLPDTSGTEDLAYLIYTSGSTGKPKGVMIEHRNVANFYAGMDQRVAHDAGGTWLAVTSLSFDISVLELFYATARGFKVVLSSDADRGLISNGPLPVTGGMEFSLYYWGNDDGVGPDKYKTLLEGAKFADEKGFVAVWTPERHFHAFGGPYPNPSVTGAAVAGLTKNIGVRAGSCVAPLHHPARIAEEWAVIDNLTNGRAGMAIASGWQPDDFVLRPENSPPDNKTAMIDSITTLRKLWAGEEVAFPRKDGSLHAVVTQPRPVSKDLPVWVTTAGNPETWKEAGRLGANVLTHLLGQSVDEVAGKIKIYHAALREAGYDPADFTVTLMLHTCLADTREDAREIAREPMKGYLRSAAGLIKQYAWAFPAFKKPEGVKNAFELDLGSLDEDELEGILDFAFERYFNDSGLFGTVEDALARTEALKKIGVGEIACLIDYGIAPDLVLEGLKPLAEVCARANQNTELPADDFSIAAQILRHDVSHLQCTPSMARMIAMNDEARFALGRVKHLMLGGEPLPGALVAEFNGLTDATITNMYGPTETTIWSSTEPARASDSVVNIGTPIANTQLYVLDEDQQPVPVGVPGELWIGGDGVTRGYWNRPELTAERFLPNPFHSGRMYRTGDLVTRRADGRIDFVGRVDHQIKLRGHRIELGEIEATLEAQTGVRQAVVAAREDLPGDLRLVGYYTSDTALDEAALKTALTGALPDYMVPSRFMRLDRFPLTPNKKVDRGALPAPVKPLAKQTPRPVARVTVATASADTEARIGAIWARVLGLDAVTGRDNFFDLGGHSLLAVQAHRLIREELGAQALSITDIFRFPVLSALAGRVSGLIAPAESGPKPATPVAANAPANDRAQARSDAMARRRAMRARRSA
ncbi:MupA/Atu3671 family FMN-dependent luciferase-like monooxygenase [Thalassococcus sp. BH17M4-6]|uniref:MupA/Atu3671 family FMN-dependent luciferase-like monooxygenase n=1 Tax=Thalassococcus sp. BH17M4-6 TaxID=3413148 RepID=UPI003BDB3388